VTFTIPSATPSGQYVSFLLLCMILHSIIYPLSRYLIRIEHIAVHSASYFGGAQVGCIHRRTCSPWPNTSVNSSILRVPKFRFDLTTYNGSYPKLKHPAGHQRSVLRSFLISRCQTNAGGTGTPGPLVAFPGAYTVCFPSRSKYVSDYSSHPRAMYSFFPSRMIH
jgi:hypothetical protein